MDFCSELGVALVVIPLMILLLVALPQVFMFLGAVWLVWVMCWGVYRLFTGG